MEVRPRGGQLVSHRVRAQVRASVDSTVARARVVRGQQVRGLPPEAVTREDVREFFARAYGEVHDVVLTYNDGAQRWLAHPWLWV